jgi:hypothetical protein
MSTPSKSDGARSTKFAFQEDLTGPLCENMSGLIIRRFTMTEIKYEIVKKVGVLSKSTSGWAKELNLISWNDREPKYDLRDWSADGGPRGDASRKMGKGVTLSREELIALKELLNEIEL